MPLRDTGLESCLGIDMADDGIRGACFIDDQARTAAPVTGLCGHDRNAIERGLPIPFVNGKRDRSHREMNMRYATTRYVRTGYEKHLELHCPDGTTRGVMFRSAECQMAALSDGRAAIDWTAVINGMLPRGATLVSRAGSRDVSELLEERAADEGPARSRDPLAAVRLRFSIGLLVRNSEYITEERDADARARDPDSARIYESIVDELENGG